MGVYADMRWRSLSGVTISTDMAIANFIGVRSLLASISQKQFYRQILLKGFR